MRSLLVLRPWSISSTRSAETRSRGVYSPRLLLCRLQLLQPGADVVLMLAIVNGGVPQEPAQLRPSLHVHLQLLRRGILEGGPGRREALEPLLLQLVQ